jgi:programmed cell death protein 5
MNGEDFQEQLRQQEKIEEIKKQILSSILTKEAYERLGRVRIVNPQLAAQVELYLLQIYQAGKIRERITDNKMKEILMAVSENKEINIKRK